MKYYIIAGEASGDLHASGLIREIKMLDSTAQFRCWGGELMGRAGGTIVKHFRDLAFMGFWEVFVNIRTILGNIRWCERDLVSFEPDVLILVDYPGFNLRMARFASLKGIRVCYYISPQLWAWRSSRVKKIIKYVDRMFVILPFEKDFYKKYGYEVDFVGHPLLDVIGPSIPLPSNDEFRRENGLDEKPLIALLPGSRRQEIGTILNKMLTVIPYFPGYRFVVAGAPSVPTSFYTRILEGHHASIVYGQTHNLLAHAQAALVTSGTATLEAALMLVPEVVCYKGNPVSYWIARQIVKVRFISLVNLIAGREVVKELIQSDFTTEALRRELCGILMPEVREQLRKDFTDLRERLGGPGASARAAALILQYLHEKSVIT
jgi:lipid-A-disaccharide synthase